MQVDGLADWAARAAGRLAARGWTIATAESCTAGLLGYWLTAPAGSSAWFTGGILAYDNRIKVEQLGVAADLLATHGAVSEPVAAAMADGVRARLGTDIGVGITGIAGPDGGTAEKPVGLVFVGLAGPGSLSCVRCCRLPGDRPQVRGAAVAAALQLIVERV